MKLDFVEVAGFRGFKDVTRFVIPSGFAVLTGRNGAGKSTLFDAIDFALTGTINKFDVKEAKGGGLESHIWWIGDGSAESSHVTVGFRTDGGERFTVTRSRDRGLVPESQEIARQLCLGDAPGERWAETLMRTTLIRDETLAGLSLDLPQQARFEAVRAAIGALTGPDYSVRTDALARAAASAKTEQEGKVAEAQADLGRALGTLTEARSVAERQPDVAQAESIIQRLAPGLGEEGRQPEGLRRHVAERKQSISELGEVLERSNNLRLLLVELDVEKAAVEKTDLEKQIEVAQAELVSANSQIEKAEQLRDAEAALDEFTAHFAALLDHGEAVGLQDHHCPLCDAARADDAFASAIASARERLSERGRRVSAATEALTQARATEAAIGTRIVEAQQKLALVERDLAWVSSEQNVIETTYRRFGITASALDPDAAQKQILTRQDETAQLEQALYILEASSAHDRVTALETRVEELRLLVESETAKLASAEKTVEATRQIKNAAVTVGNQVLTEQFDTVMPLLKELYRRLRPHTDWREIETDFGGRIRASLNFTVGDGKNPQFLFSSGQRRAAGLAFLLAIHLSRPWCRLQSLLLDDPVQHVDDYRALNLVEVLSSIRRGGRQVIVAVEDPALADLLCRRLRSSSEEPGRRFELGTANNGSAVIHEQIDIEPMPSGVLQLAEAS